MNIFDFDKEDIPWISAGIASHHKDAKEIIEGRYSLLAEPEDLALDELKEEVNEETVNDLILWLEKTAKEWLKYKKLNEVDIPLKRSKIDISDFIFRIPETVSFTLREYNKLVGEIEREPYTSLKNISSIFLRGLIVKADHIASANISVVETIEFPDEKKLAATIGIKKNDLRTYQRIAGSTTGSIILSAPTGSGKTEAGLLWAHKQQQNTKVKHHLIYILPYQASLDAMYKRIKEIIGCEVALIHGRSLQSIFRELMDAGYTKRESEILARRSNDLARLYQPPVWCTTPYQLLRAAYRLPGYEALWTSLAGALIVIDEIHAYEPSRLGMFIALLSELRERWSVTLCLMTATMPSWLRKILTSIADIELPVDESVFKTFQRHKITIIEGNILDPEIHQLIKEEISSGKTVLVGVNTVKTAQRVSEALKKIIDDKIVLIHGRFTARDRLNKESLILDKIKISIKEFSPIVVIATQVIEVSLNLDFDTIITEPAPLEALIQRFGRVNRQGKKGTVSVRILTQSIDDEKVYDQDLVSKSVDILKRNNNSIINELMIGKWLNDVYSGIENKFADSVLWHKEEFKKSCLYTLKAFNSNPELAKKFDELFDNTEVLPKSLSEEYKRLYEQSVIEAKSLLVPISWKQFLRNKKFIYYNHKWSLWIIDKPYNCETGLEI